MESESNPRSSASAFEALKTAKSFLGQATALRIWTCPARGQFTLEIGLQINVPPGLYLVEALVRDLDLGRRIASGPRICIRVADSRHFDGSVQMNASFRLVTLGEL